MMELEPWLVAISSSACIGCTSLVPWLFNMTFFEQDSRTKISQTKNSRMDYLLSFSIGAILGDIFFHLIPESIGNHMVELDIPIVKAQKKVGLSLVSGIFMFIIVEMLLERWSNPSNNIPSISGYLNLIANGFDNFTHGLAIGASFLAGTKVGLMTTFVIFIHEIPHEICDYAILVNSGFSRWEAVKAQSSVSLFGIMGTVAALYFKSTAGTIWILPFSAGGFLHIALVNLMPQTLSRKTEFRDSIEQIGCVIVGVTFMGLVALT